MFKVISLFSGAGGLDLGFKGGFRFLNQEYPSLPFQIVWSGDLNQRACDTLSHNFPKQPVFCGDIVELSQGEFPKADVVLGGFPCQDFSLAGKRQGLNVERGKLYLNMIEVIKKVQPKIFLAENVKGLLTWENGLAIKTITKDFAQLGYSVEYKLLNTADYGVPQKRERVIIIGVKKGLNLSFHYPLATHSNSNDNLAKWITAEQALSDLENDTIHFAMKNSGYSKAKFLKGKQGNTAIKADQPAPTMRAEHHGNIEYHYKLPRRLSAREVARLQTFPDNFEFLKSTTDAYRQIGNAVPPVFAWHFAKAISNTLNEQS